MAIEQKSLDQRLGQILPSAAPATPLEDIALQPLPGAAEVPAEPVVTKVEMAEYSLADGTKVMISALEIGGKVEMADGTPAPQGEHQLMDGTIIQVDELGIIIEIASPKEDVIEEEPIAPAAPVAPAVNVSVRVEPLAATNLVLRCERSDDRFVGE